MSNNIFRRIEKKYIITQEQYERIKELLLLYTVEDKYGKSKICNLYFDSDDYCLIRNSITKPVYKDKVRLRSYNTPTGSSNVYLEIKKKYKKVVGKRRIEMKLNDFYRYLEDKDSIKIENEQIKREIDYYFEFYKLKPKMYISYDREAYYETGNKDFRVTFDSNITARRKKLDLAKGSFGEKILDEDKYIMEIKTLGVIPMWLVKIISDYKLQPGGFSKYGVAYEKLVLGGRKEAKVKQKIEIAEQNELATV